MGGHGDRFGADADLGAFMEQIDSREIVTRVTVAWPQRELPVTALV
jgi:hypothetical protein